MVSEHIPVGDSGRSRALKGRGSGGVIDEIEVAGAVPELLSAILTELRRQTRLLATFIDEDIDDDE